MRIVGQLNILLVVFLSLSVLTGNPSFGSDGDPELIRAEIPIGNPSDDTYIEVTVGQVDRGPTMSRRQFGRELARKIKVALRLSADEPVDFSEEDTALIGAQDPRSSDHSLEEFTEIVEEAAGDLGVGMAGPIIKKKEINEAEELLEEGARTSVLRQMISPSNITFAVIRFVITGGVFARTIMLDPGVDPSQALTIGAVAGLLSASLQITNPLYAEWAARDKYTDKILNKWGTTPMRSFILTSGAIWVKWGLVLEGIFFGATELSRMGVGLGVDHFEFGKVMWGVTLTTMTQGIWEMAGAQIRKRSDLLANVIAFLASATYSAAAGALLLNNYELSNMIYLGLGVTGWAAAGYVYRDWLRSVYDFYEPRLRNVINLNKWKQRLSTFSGKVSQPIRSAVNRCKMALGGKTKEPRSYDPFEQDWWDDAS